MDALINSGYGELLGEIKTRIRTAQYDALRAVNNRSALPVPVHGAGRHRADAGREPADRHPLVQV